MSVERDSGVRATHQGWQPPDSDAPDSDVIAISPAIDRGLIQEANRELEERARDHLAVPIAVVIEQRDQALEQLADAQARAARERAALVKEQDAFITFLMGEHETITRDLETRLTEAVRELEIQRALALSGTAEGANEPQADPSADRANTDTVEELRQLLHAAHAEIDDTRGDAIRLQEERDEAFRSIDEVRVELLSQVEEARDEAFRLQTELDESARLVEDARDAARDRAIEFAEELDTARRDLDERNAEVRRLRQRLSEREQEARFSRPPPPAAMDELLAARQEAQVLRKQLIDAKRDVARLARELQLSGRIRMRKMTPR